MKSNRASATWPATPPSSCKSPSLLASRCSPSPSTSGNSSTSCGSAQRSCGGWAACCPSPAAMWHSS
eukprot:1788787-Prymnesium_polylepis.1